MQDQTDHLKGTFGRASEGKALPPCRAFTLPISLRVTFEEKAQLDRDAAGMSLSGYIRWRLFDPDSPPPKSRGRFPVKDHQALTRVLGQLGQSRLANNLNQLARSANTGSLLMDGETERLIAEAAADVAEMRRLLMQALRVDG